VISETSSSTIDARKNVHVGAIGKIGTREFTCELARIDPELAFRSIREFTLPDQPLERRVVAGTAFQGRVTPIFPELGEQRLRIFTGVQEDLLRAATADPIRSEEIAKSLEQHFQEDQAHPQAGEEEPNVSVGPGGSCLIVDGLF
jgi:hypothetical protein